MIATATQVHPPSLTLRNMASHETNGRPRDGWLNLTREMETDEDEQFDVDLTILDFLVYKATDLVFEWKQSDDPYHSDLPNALVSMTADWRTVLSHRHQGRRLEPRAAFRSRLLQFALLFTHRMHHEETWTTEESLHELRESNKARGEYWQQRTQHPDALQQHDFDAQKDFPLSDGALHANRTQLAALLSMPLDQRRWVTDVAGTPALHCILPLLIELTAARVDLGDDWLPTSEWFDLVGQFMLQAVTEEYLRQGAHGSDTFNTIFAFGCPGVDRWAEEPETVMAMRRLFCDEDNRRQEHADWSHVKRHYINELLPQNSARSFLRSIERAQQLHPYTIFEDRVLSFLKSLHEGVDKPDLIQVEEGRISIDGNELSDTESREMIRRMGL